MSIAYKDTVDELRNDLKALKIEVDKMKIMHEFTTETLYHYNCGECKQWWSYATTEERTNPFPFKYPLYCPHCGAKGKSKKKEI